MRPYFCRSMNGTTARQQLQEQGSIPKRSAPMGDDALAKSGETHHPRHPFGDTVPPTGKLGLRTYRARPDCSCSFREMSFRELTIELSAFDASLRMRGAIARGLSATRKLSRNGLGGH